MDIIYILLRSAELFGESEAHGESSMNIMESCDLKFG